jgi:hypothetical protein
MDDLNSDTPIRTIWDRCKQRLSGLGAIDLSRDIVQELQCPSCGSERDIYAALDLIDEEQAVCGRR